MTKFAPYAKAIVGALIAGLGALGTALTDNDVSAQEWVGIVSALLVALGVVFAVPNKDPEGEHQEESVQPTKQPILGKAFTSAFADESRPLSQQGEVRDPSDHDA